MADTLPAIDGALNLNLPPRLVLEVCPQVRTELCAHFASGRPIRLNAGGVRDIDYAGVQLLIAAKKSAERAGLAFSVAGSVEGDGVVAAAFKRAGVELIS